MLTQFSRTELLLGKEAMNKLEDARVAVFGIGGVGGYVCEALVRSGVGKFDLIDDGSSQSKELVKALMENKKDVSYCEIQSPCGHDAFLLEYETQTRIIRSFLCTD